MEDNNFKGTQDNGGNEGGNAAEKTGIQKALDKVQRGWMRFSTSKGGRWAIRGTKAILIGIGLKTAYDAGVKSVKPTVVMVTPVEEEALPETTEEPAEAPVEETAAEN